ncbi:MAG: hypothetical protein GY754_23645 [bacterium]|nr:hypothetical protein [bacterium]
MDEILKEKLNSALNNSKDALGELSKVVKNISKDMAESTKGKGGSIKDSSGELFKGILTGLKDVGKNSIEFVGAAGSGLIQGVSEANKENKEKKEAANEEQTELKDVVKNVTKVVADNSREQGQNLKDTSGEFFKGILGGLKNVGSDSVELVKAASSGFVEGIKESDQDENATKSLFTSLGSSIKNLGEAGVHVSAETAKTVVNTINDLVSTDKKK